MVGDNNESISDMNVTTVEGSTLSGITKHNNRACQGRSYARLHAVGQRRTPSPATQLGRWKTWWERLVHRSIEPRKTGSRQRSTSSSRCVHQTRAECSTALRAAGLKVYEASNEIPAKGGAWRWHCHGPSIGARELARAAHLADLLQPENMVNRDNTARHRISNRTR